MTINITHFIKTAKAVIDKNSKITFRAYPLSFFLSRIIGGICILLFQASLYYVIFKGNLSTEFIYLTGTQNYIAYIVLGEAQSILLFSTLMNVGRCLITEIREGTLDTFLLSPASRLGYYTGAYIEQFGRGLIEYLIIIAFGYILGFRLSTHMLIKFSLITFFASFSFFSLAIIISTLMVWTRDTYLIQNTIFLLIQCLCGVAFPIEYLPKALQYMGEVFPLTPVLKIFRNCILNGMNLYECVNWIIQTLVLSILYIFIGYYGFKKIEKKLIQDVLA